MRVRFLLAICSVGLLAACTTPQGNEPAVAPQPPTATPAPAAPSVPPPPPVPPPAAPVQASAPDGLPAGVGREAVLKGCGGCHGIGQVVTERRSRQEWSDTVTNMINQGAPVSEAEFEQVVTYLATHFGP